MHLGTLRQDGRHRLLLYRHDGVAGDQGAIAFTEECDVSGGMAGCEDMAPARHHRDRSVVRQDLQAPAHIDRTAWIQAREERHDAAADKWIRRWVRRLAVQVWTLEAVRIHRHIPALEQFVQRTHVIEMAMGQNDGLWWRTRAGELCGCVDDGARVTGQTGVHQHPRAAGAHDVNVDHERPDPEDAFCCYFAELHVMPPIEGTHAAFAWGSQCKQYSEGCSAAPGFCRLRRTAVRAGVRGNGASFSAVKVSEPSSRSIRCSLFRNAFVRLYEIQEP